MKARAVEALFEQTSGAQLRLQELERRLDHAGRTASDDALVDYWTRAFRRCVGAPVWAWLEVVAERLRYGGLADAEAALLAKVVEVQLRKLDRDAAVAMGEKPARRGRPRTSEFELYVFEAAAHDGELSFDGDPRTVDRRLAAARHRRQERIAKLERLRELIRRELFPPPFAD